MPRRHGWPEGRRRCPSPVTAAEGAALPADDVLARLGSGTLGVPGDEAARRLRVVGPNAVRSQLVHALSVLASQLRTRC
jgi:hypothetical protein